MIHPHAETFKEIERTVEERVAVRIATLKERAANPTIDEEIPQTRIINGLEIRDIDHAAREEQKTRQRISNEHLYQIAKLRADIDQYERDARALRDKLTKIGVEPLALIPRGAWDAIRKQYDLFEFGFNENGSVNAAMPDFIPITERLFTLNIVYVCLALGVVFVAPVSIDSFFGPMSGWVQVMLGTTLAFAAVIFLFKGLPSSYNPRRVVRAYLRGKSHLDLLRDLFPGNRTPADAVAKLTINLPTPPQQVAEKIVLLDKNGVDFFVTAEPDAVEFVPKIDVQLREIAQPVLRREMVRFSDLFDPIVHVNQGDAIAIVAQYGPFLLEAAAIERILTEETTLLTPSQGEDDDHRGTLRAQINQAIDSSGPMF
ncbi:MAG: hypothetical protein WDZ93_02960 [Candidatus Paceibacterota bacterium]